MLFKNTETITINKKKLKILKTKPQLPKYLLYIIQVIISKKNL